MIGGIFETIGKTLGVGKEKYFLELDDAAEDTVKGIKKAASKAASTAKDIASDVAEKAQDLTGDAAEKVEDAVGDAAAKGKSTAKEAAAKVQKTAKQASEAGESAKQSVQDAAKTTAKKADQTAKKAQKANEAKANQPEKADAPVQTAAVAPDPDEIIVNAIAAGSRKRNGGAVGPNGEALNFSTDYLMSQKKMRRRRPGPSFSNYKGMAKEVNPRLK